MQSANTVPFFYIVKHLSGMRYAGVKFAKGCKPSDLLTTYNTSSKVVHKLLEENPGSFVVESIIQFNDKEEAILYEKTFLINNNCHLSNEWLNLSAGRAINPDAVRLSCIERYGVDNWMKTNDGKELSKKKMLGNTYTLGQKRSAETKDKMSKAFKGRVYSDEHNSKCAIAATGRKASQETKDKMSKARTRGKHHKAAPVHTPQGVFDCLKDAADFYNITDGGIRRRCSSDNFPEYYKLNKKLP